MEYSTDIDGWNVRAFQHYEYKSYDSVSYVYVIIMSDDGKQSASIDADGAIEIDNSNLEEYERGNVPVNVMIVAIEMWKTVMNLPQ